MTWLEFGGQGSKAQVLSMLDKAGTEMMPWRPPYTASMKLFSFSVFSVHCLFEFLLMTICFENKYVEYIHQVDTSTQTVCTHAQLWNFSLCGQIWFNFCPPLCTQPWQPWDELHSHLLNECLAKSQQLTAPELVEVAASKPFLLPNVHSRSATFAKCSLGQRRDKRTAACHHLWVMAPQQKV